MIEINRTYDLIGWVLDRVPGEQQPNRRFLVLGVLTAAVLGCMVVALRLLYVHYPVILACTSALLVFGFIGVCVLYTLGMVVDVLLL